MPTRKKKPTSHKFEKVILTEGIYKVPGSQGSVTHKITPTKIKSIASTFSRMKEKGINVPAPWKHDFNVNAFYEGDDGLLTDSSTNGGFWDSLFTRVNEKGKTELVGVIEVPGDPEDPNTPAGKIGKTVRETSIYLRGQHELTDESGEVLKDVPMHIALVTHPIENSQKNFELKSPDYAIAMSQMIVTDTGLIDLAKKLKEVAKIFIPDSTTLEDLPRNLLIALSQKELSPDDEDDDLSNKRDTLIAEPIIMSKLSQEQIDAILKAEVVNPSTKKPFTADELKAETPQKSKDDDKKDLIMSAMAATMESDRKTSYRTRIQSLVANRQTSEEYANANLYPKVDNYSLQFTEEGKVATPIIEELIMSLETVPPPTKSHSIDDDLLDEVDLGLGADDEKKMDEIADSIMQDLGI